MYSSEPERKLFTCLWHFLMVYLLANQDDYNSLQANLMLDKHLMIKKIYIFLFLFIHKLPCFLTGIFVEHKNDEFTSRQKTWLLASKEQKKKLILHAVL